MVSSEKLRGIPYGKGVIPFPETMPAPALVLEPGPFREEDPVRIVEESLDHPVNSPPIAGFFPKGKRIACVIPDITRRAGVRVYLPVLLNRMLENGHSSDDIVVVIALGIHRPMTEKEIIEHVGSWVWERFAVRNHDSREKNELVSIGNTDGGISVSLNRTVAESSGILLTGGVTYHYFAGYGGGRKTLLPGVVSRETCEANHRIVVRWRRGEIDGILGPGILHNNPVHREMLSACRILTSPIYSLNVVTCPDGEIKAAFSGDLETAHLEACRFLDRCCRKRLDRKHSLVIASVGGYPKDINFIQAHKGLYSAHQVVEKGGVVILAAKCQDGEGNPDFLSWFRRCHNEEQWMAALCREYQINGQTAYSTWLKVKDVTTVLVSEMSPEAVRLMGMVPCSDLECALREAKGILGELPRPLVVTDASDTLAEYDSSKSEG